MSANEILTRLEQNDETVMDTSLGSDGERSGSSLSDTSTTPPMTPTENQKGTLKFSIANILRPEFGKVNQTIKSPLSPSDRPQMMTPGTPFDLTTTRKLFGIGQAAAAAISATTTTAVSPFPAWVYCTRYSDRPSSGPRCRRMKRASTPKQPTDEKRPRTAFTSEQLNRLKKEFQENRYLTEKRRQELAHELGLNESQIKIWFQNKRAKIKKQCNGRNSLALHLMAQGLYNHSTVPLLDDMDMDMDESID